MKVIHASAWYFPDTTGGTEVYVDNLTRELGKRGVQSTIVAPRNGTASTDYLHQDIPIHRFPVFQPCNLQQLRGEFPHGGFEKFEEWLGHQNADIYHQHSWDLGCGIFHLKEAKRRGFRTILTVHMPNIICSRGTMMLFGSEACDGHIDEIRCGACRIQGKGLPKTFASFFSGFPKAWGNRLSPVFPQKLATLLSTRQLIANTKRQFAEMLSSVDKIVVVNKWLYEAFLLNGANRGKMIICRHGYPERNEGLEEKALRKTEVLELGYVGRWSHVKGIDLIIKAIQEIPQEIPLRLHIHGIADLAAEKKYRQDVLSIIQDDPRIIVEEPLARSEVMQRLKSFDFLLVPSKVMETGPYVVLEALAAGTPVIGSNLGGIAEWIRPGVNGELLPFDQVDPWKEILIHFAKEPSALERFKFQESLRSMSDVASEMKVVYEALI